MQEPAMENNHAQQKVQPAVTPFSPQAAVYTVQTRQKMSDAQHREDIVPALEITHVGKTFGTRMVLQDITLSVMPGEIFGFLGPNGSGKTTTIKLALGLLKLEQGDIRICGHSIKTDFETAIRQAGGIIEKPELYKYLTGRQNLELFRKMYPDLPAEQVDGVLQMTGMYERRNDKVKTYSLGMCQRLGIAQALLHSPKLLILDEPTNGLDPNGIRELRETLKMLASTYGVAVFISSHQLAELDLMCDRFAVLSGGLVAGVGNMADLKNYQSSSANVFIIEAEDPDACVVALDAYSDCLSPCVKDGKVWIKANKETLSKLYGDVFIPNQLTIYTVTRQEKSLEEAYLEMTAPTGNGGAVQ